MICYYNGRSYCDHPVKDLYNYAGSLSRTISPCSDFYVGVTRKDGKYHAGLYRKGTDKYKPGTEVKSLTYGYKGAKDAVEDLDFTFKHGFFNNYLESLDPKWANRLPQKGNK